MIFFNLFFLHVWEIVFQWSVVSGSQKRAWNISLASGFPAVGYGFLLYLLWHKGWKRLTVVQCVSRPSVVTRCFHGENILALAWARLLKSTVPHQRCQRTSCFLFPTAAAWSWHFVQVIYAITAPLRTGRTPGEFSLPITSPLGTQTHITDRTLFRDSERADFTTMARVWMRMMMMMLFSSLFMSSLTFDIQLVKGRSLMGIYLS